MKDQPPASGVAVGGRAVPANGGNIYDHFEANYVYPNGYRVFLANRQSTGCFNGTLDYVMGTEGTLFLGKGQPRIETPDGKVKWQFEGEDYDMYQREHDVLFASIREGKPKNDDLNLATSTLLAIMGRDAAYSGQQITWEQALNSRSACAAADGLEREVRGPGARHSGTHQGRSDRMTLASPRVAAAGCRRWRQAVPSPPARPQADEALGSEGTGRRRAHPRADPRAGQEDGRRPSPAAYKVTIPNTTATFGMAPIPAGEFEMGSGDARRQARRAAAAQGHARRVLDDDQRGQLGRVPDVHVRRPGQREGTPGRARRRAEPPDRAASRDELRPGQHRLSRHQHDPACRQQIRPVAERADRRVLPGADRGRVGIRLPRRAPPVPAAQLADVAWFKKNSRDGSSPPAPITSSERRSRTPGASTTCWAT